MARFVELVYCRRSEYAYRDAAGDVHHGPADEGVEQGDAFAPALFSHGVREALRRAQARMDGLPRDASCAPSRVFAYWGDVVIVM